MNSCAPFEERVDLIAAGELTLTAEDAAHLDGCPACRGVLRRAQALETVLASRPALEPPPAFTARVMTAVQGERWREEQVLDLGFNVAIAAGLLLVTMGLLGLAWSTGLIVIGGDLAGLASAGMTLMLERAATQAPNVGGAALLLTMALAVWWWAEGVEV